MKFNIMMIDPPDFPHTHFLNEAAKCFAYGIESLGHDCCITPNNFDVQRINIIFGGHHINDPNQVKQLASAPTKYIVYQSKKLNAIVQPNAPSLPHFQQVYLPLMQHAVQVWEGVPEHAGLLQKAGCNVLPVRMGYHPDLNEIFKKPNPEFDFLFFGQVTQYRQRQLLELERRGHHVLTIHEDEAIFRNDLIASARVHLALPRSEKITHLSHRRVCYLLNNECLVVSERTTDQGWLQNCMVWADRNQWVQACIHTLQRADREQLRQHNIRNYQQIRVENILRPAIDALNQG